MPNIPDIIDFGPNDSQADLQSRVEEMFRLKLRFKEFCKSSLIPFEHYTQMGMKPPNLKNITSTKMQMTGFHMIHFAVHTKCC